MPPEMPPELLLFAQTPASRRPTQWVGAGLVLAGAALGGASAFLGGLTAARLEAAPLGGLLLCCGAPFALGLVLAGAWVVAFAGRRDPLLLDPERLTWQEHALPLERIVRVALDRDPQGAFSVRVEDDAGGVIPLAVTQDGHVGTYDVRALLQALLPRLGPLCAVDPRVRAYAEGAPLA